MIFTLQVGLNAQNGIFHHVGYRFLRVEGGVRGEEDVVETAEDGHLRIVDDGAGQILVVDAQFTRMTPSFIFEKAVSSIMW